MAQPTSDATRRGDLYLKPRNDVTRNLDPALQEIVLRHRDDASLANQQVDVTVRLKSTNARVPAGLTVVRRHGDLVTGTVAVAEIEAVRQRVASLKAAKPVRPLLRDSVPEIRTDAQTLRRELGSAAPDGSGVIVGIVDYGCDFRHGNFISPSGETRILYLWDQRASGDGRNAPQGFGYGREITSHEINQALRSGNPYVTLNYRPGVLAHGTHVMDIAAGNGRETGAPGVAPGADLIFVHLAADDAGEEESFGNSRHLMEAVDYIFEKAGNRPVVVNLSLGTHAGPHDGSTPVEQWFDRLLETPGRAIVIAAGNSRNVRGHTRGLVTNAAPKSFTWQIRPNDLTANELDIWYEGGRKLDVSLYAPDGTLVGTVPLGETHDILRQGSRESQGWIFHRENDPNNGDNEIDILLRPTLLRGSWRVELSTTDGQPVPFHAWIERDDAGPSSFAPQDTDSAYTLGSISCGEWPIVVGAYNPRKETIATFSSEGPTRNERQKPEISAPGEDIYAANSGGGSRPDNGTSMAAPHVTGLVALLFQAASPRRLPIQETRATLLDAARPVRPGVTWDARFGRGRADGVRALETEAEVAAPAPAAAGLPKPVRDDQRLQPLHRPTEERAQPGANGDHGLAALLVDLYSKGLIELRSSNSAEIQ